MTMTTTKAKPITRNATLSAYVRRADRLAVLARQIKDLQREQDAALPGVLEIIGERAAVTVAGSVRILERSETVSVSRIGTDEETALACQAAGLATDERSAVYVSASKLRSYALAGKLPADVAAITRTPIIVIH